MVIIGGRVCRQMAVNDATVVVIGLVGRVCMHMDEWRRGGAHLQAEAQEQDEDWTIHPRGFWRTSGRASRTP